MPKGIAALVQRDIRSGIVGAREARASRTAKPLVVISMIRCNTPDSVLKIIKEIEEGG